MELPVPLERFPSLIKTQEFLHPLLAKVFAEDRGARARERERSHGARTSVCLAALLRCRPAAPLQILPMFGSLMPLQASPAPGLPAPLPLERFTAPLVPRLAATPLRQHPAAPLRRPMASPAPGRIRSEPCF